MYSVLYCTILCQGEEQYQQGWKFVLRAVLYYTLSGRGTVPTRGKYVLRAVLYHILCQGEVQCQQGGKYVLSVVPADRHRVQ